MVNVDCVTASICSFLIYLSRSMFASVLSTKSILLLLAVWSLVIVQEIKLSKVMQCLVGSDSLKCSVK